MSLKRTIDKLIGIYGIDIILRRFTTVTNEYGEEVEDTYTDETIRVIIDSYILTSFARQLFGYVNDEKMTVVVSSDVELSRNDKLIIDGKEWTIDTIRDLIYKGEVVAKQVVLV